MLQGRAWASTFLKKHQSAVKASSGHPKKTHLGPTRALTIPLFCKEVCIGLHPSPQSKSCRRAWWPPQNHISILNVSFFPDRQGRELLMFIIIKFLL
jgi:hypothetical protein